ncbi:MAG: sulfotransferase [Chitinophagales bacterium]|nr:sulfotransferase [Chitinophagales bacterium]
MKHDFPNLFVPGAGKSGTSSLHLYLGRHPGITMMQVKEPHFFSRDEYYRIGWDAYLQGYASGNFKGQYLGESSTTYFLSVKAITRIQSDIRDPKFIFLLKNPVDRILSHYNWIRTIGEQLPPFRKEVTDDLSVPFDADQPMQQFYYKSYVEFSRYGKWIQHFFSAFGKENCHILLAEQLEENPLPALNGCFRFLQLPAMEAITPITENKTKDYFYSERPRTITRLGKKLLPPQIRKKIIAAGVLPFPTTKKIKVDAPPYIAAAEERKWLRSLLSDDFLHLKKITEIDFSSWTDFYEAG